jgi:hypothetical protein
MFSYLPAGAPPWPTTIPQHFARPQEDTLSSQYEQKKGRTRPKRSAASIAAIAAFIVLVPLLGAAATLGILYLNHEFPTASAARTSARVSTQATPATASTPSTGAATTPAPSTSGGQLPTPTSFKKTKDTNLNVSLQYPSDWVTEGPQKLSDGSTSVGIHPSQQIPIEFVFIRFSNSASSSINTPQQANQANIQTVGSSFNAQDLQQVQPANAQPMIGGTKWVEEDVTFLDANGDKFHVSTISVKHENTYYSIIFLVPDVYFTEAMQKYIQPMLNSLQFLS